jgi:hypothetical protein
MHTAHISFRGGGLILPAVTPYQRQLVFEHFEASAKQHQNVGLRVQGRYWSISVKLARRERCAECVRSLHDLAYRADGQNFCNRCTRRALQ